MEGKTRKGIRHTTPWSLRARSPVIAVHRCPRRSSEAPKGWGADGSHSSTKCNSGYRWIYRLGARWMRFASSPGYDRLMCLRYPLRPLHLCVRHVRAHLSRVPAAIAPARAFRSGAVGESAGYCTGIIMACEGCGVDPGRPIGGVSGCVPITAEPRTLTSYGTSTAAACSRPARRSPSASLAFRSGYVWT